MRHRVRLFYFHKCEINKVYLALVLAEEVARRKYLEVDIVTGQKTGAYLDQAENRRLIRPYCSGAIDLKLFQKITADVFLDAGFETED